MKLLVLSVVVMEVFLLVLGWSDPSRFLWMLALCYIVLFLAGIDMMLLHKARASAVLCLVLAVAGIFCTIKYCGISEEQSGLSEYDASPGVLSEERQAGAREGSAFLTGSVQKKTLSKKWALAWSWIASGALVLMLLETLVIWFGWNTAKDTAFQLKRAQPE